MKTKSDKKIKKIKKIEKIEKIETLPDGSCGVYAFIVGLLHLAKTNPCYIEKWREFDSDFIDSAQASIVNTGQLSQLNLQEFSLNATSIKPFMRSMRKILLKDILSELSIRKPYQKYRNTLVFKDLAQLCESMKPENSNRADYQPSAMQTNFLYQSSDPFFQNLAYSIFIFQKEHPSAVQDYQDKLICAALLKHQSEFEQYYSTVVNEESTWLSHHHLQCLAEKFQVPLITNTPQQYPQEPYIHLLNASNIHWETLLYVPGPSNAEQPSIESRYRSAVNNFFNEKMQENYFPSSGSSPLRENCRMDDFNFAESKQDIAKRFDSLSTIYSTINTSELAKQPINELKSQFLNDLGDFEFFMQFYHYCEAYQKDSQSIDTQIHYERVRLSIYSVGSSEYQDAIERLKALEQEKDTLLEKEQRQEMNDLIERLQNIKPVSPSKTAQPIIQSKTSSIFQEPSPSNNGLMMGACSGFILGCIFLTMGAYYGLPVSVLVSVLTLILCSLIGALCGYQWDTPGLK